MADVIAVRYAEALFDAAIEAGQDPEATLANTLSDVHRVQDVFGSNEELARFLELPDIGIEAKSNLLERIFQNEIEEPLKGFLYVLVHKGRIGYMDEIFSVFEALVMEKQGKVTATVTSATELSQGELDRIRDTLKASMKKEILLETRIDPQLYGGLVVRVGDVVFDNSIRSSLTNLSKHLRSLRIVDAESMQNEKVV